MRFKIIFLLVISVLSISCKKQEKAKSTIQEVQLDSEVSKKITINKSAKFVNDWVEISNLELEVTKLLTKKFKSEKDLELLITRLTELKNTIPEKYNQPAILARIKVLETNTMLFEQALKDKDIKDTNSLLENIITSYNTLSSQIEALIIKQKDYEMYK